MHLTVTTHAHGLLVTRLHDCGYAFVLRVGWDPRTHAVYLRDYRSFPTLPTRTLPTLPLPHRVTGTVHRLAPVAFSRSPTHHPTRTTLLYGSATLTWHVRARRLILI